VSDGAAAPPLAPIETGHSPITRSRPGSSWPERARRALGALPWPVAESLFAGLGVLDGLVRPRRRGRALEWASAQPRGRHGRWGLAIRLLANHGRFIAQEHLVETCDPTALRDRVRLLGEEHLAAAGSGATILLGFHVGPPRTPVALQALGYPVTAMPDLTSRAAASRPKPSEEPTVRAVALLQARRLLARHEWLYIAADGPPGVEAYRIPLPGGPVIIREGWLTLRRLTGAPTVPVLAHREGSRRVITIHPALPPVASDPRADADVCCTVLADLLGSYLRRFPEQCRATLWRP